MSESIRLDPKRVRAYNDRGSAWFGLLDYDRATADFAEVIRIEPKNALPCYVRAALGFVARRDTALADVRKAQDLDAWKTTTSLKSAFIGHFAARTTGGEQDAKAFLDVAAEKWFSRIWPYPVLKYLRGEIDDKAVLDAAGNDGERTTAHTDIGVDLLLKGQKDAAKEHFDWVKDKGAVIFPDYGIALGELARLTAEKP